MLIRISDLEEFEHYVNKHVKKSDTEFTRVSTIIKQFDAYHANNKLLSSEKKKYLRRYGDATKGIRVYDKQDKAKVRRNLLPVTLNNKFEFSKHEHVNLIKARHVTFNYVYCWDIRYSPKGITLLCLDGEHVTNGEIAQEYRNVNILYFHMHERHKQYQAIKDLGTSIIGKQLIIDAIHDPKAKANNYNIIQAGISLNDQQTTDIRKYQGYIYQWLEKEPYIQNSGTTIINYQLKKTANA